MIPVAYEWGIVVYAVIQALIASIAVALALKWGKYEFLAGLAFLLLYAIIDVVDLIIFTVMQGVYLDVAQFGIILLAIIFFIIGMHPSWSRGLVPHRKEPAKKPDAGVKSPDSSSIFSILRKM